MGNAWTRLTQEAAKYGGPNGLRQHYANAGAAAVRSSGRLQGFATGLGSVLAGTVLGMAADKGVDMVLNRKKAPQPEAQTVASGAPDRCDHRCDHHPGTGFKSTEIL